MSDRKQTPDVLADILAGAASTVSDAGTPLPESEVPGAGSLRRPGVRQASAPKPAERAPRRGRPPSWEYLVVSCQEYRGWRPRYVNGFEAYGWMEGPLIHDYLEQRGQEGWELVGVAAGKPMYSVSDSYQLYFRRARQ